MTYLWRLLQEIRRQNQGGPRGALLLQRPLRFTFCLRGERVTPTALPLSTRPHSPSASPEDCPPPAHRSAGLPPHPQASIPRLDFHTNPSSVPTRLGQATPAFRATATRESTRSPTRLPVKIWASRLARVRLQGSLLPNYTPCWPSKQQITRIFHSTNPLVVSFHQHWWINPMTRLRSTPVLPRSTFLLLPS